VADAELVPATYIKGVLTLPARFSMIFSVASLVVAMLAIMVTVWHERRRRKTEAELRRQQEIIAAWEVEKIQEEKARQNRAHLRAELLRVEKFIKLRVWNDYGTPALDVSMNVTPIGPGISPLSQDRIDRTFPIERLEANNPGVSIPTAFSWSASQAMRVHLRWKDEGGNRMESVVDLHRP
jgi:hypothetical protein